MPSQASNPLFHGKTLNNAINGFNFPQDLVAKQQKILAWLGPLKQGILDEFKEVSLHGDFLRTVFQEGLGYRSVVEGDGKNWEIHAERTIADGGGSADAALGLFTTQMTLQGKAKLSGPVIAPIELKGAKEILDRAAPGRQESAVEQGWRYANYTPNCQWIIISNYREIRLYHTSKTPAYYQSFFLVDLEDLTIFKQFYFLFCRDNFLPKISQDRKSISRIDQLFLESEEAEEAITKKLYKLYQETRTDLIDHFRRSFKENLENRDVILIEKAQKLLDRILFIGFCEDRGLLPKRMIRKAHDFENPYQPTPIWENYKALFRWVDAGNEKQVIPGYNGGLFKYDPLLDGQLPVTNLLCTQLKNLTEFDFETEVSVNILGHIFEQSVSDLEALRAQAKGINFEEKKGKRKVQGVYYTPSFITEYIVGVALGNYLKEKEREIGDRLQLESLTNMNNSANKKEKERLEQEKRRQEEEFWRAYREVLLGIRVIDPACGSGAFLIAAFDYLSREYERVNEALARLASDHQTQGQVSSDVIGQRSLFDLTQTLLTQNLYGVDLSPESVEITKLSLWLKTAERGKPLTDLEQNIKVGNAIIADPQFDPLAFDWQAEFPQIFETGGFDVVIGNPPYVRQELLSTIKPYLQGHYQSYHGVADLYTYFYEQGVNILKTGGLLSYIVTNKWLKAGYGEALRRFFTQNSWIEQIIDFGHAPIFEDADVFPCIILVRKSAAEENLEMAKMARNLSVRVCPVPRERLENLNLPQYVEQAGYEVPWSRFTAAAWSLESPAVERLMQKIKAVGVPLTDFTGIKPYRGILTGFNEAFLIDDQTRQHLVKDDPKCAEIIKPYLRGQDIRRWHSSWQNLWMIVISSSSDYHWNWTHNDSAETLFSTTYPSLYSHLKPFEEKLKKRLDKGRYWWELRPCAYYDSFEQAKVIWKDLSTYSEFCFDSSGILTNDLCFILPSSDLWLLAVLNSPLMWSYLFRATIHGANETLRLKNIYTELLPIAPPTDNQRSQVEDLASRLIEVTQQNQQAQQEVFNWLKIDQGIQKLGQKLENFANLSSEEFIEEVKKRKPKGSGFPPKTLKALQDVYQDYVPILQNHQTMILTLEKQVSHLINQAYQLTPEDIELLWQTAPPRMPPF